MLALPLIGLMVLGVHGEHHFNTLPYFTEDGTIRIVGLRLRFTDNSFGDKDPTIGTVVDPFGTGGATGSEAELLSARAAVGMSMIDPEELERLRRQASEYPSDILLTSTLPVDATEGAGDFTEAPSVDTGIGTGTGTGTGVRVRARVRVRVAGDGPEVPLSQSPSPSRVTPQKPAAPCMHA